MNYFLDTEFTCLPWDGTAELISIGIVDENDREYYACLNDFSAESVSLFVEQNIIPYLPYISERKSRQVVSEELFEFISAEPEPPGQIWCLFPTEDELKEWGFKEGEIPNVIEKYGDIDLQLLEDLLGFRYPADWPGTGSNLVPIMNKLKEKERVPDNEQIHNALADARWNKKVWEVASTL